MNLYEKSDMAEEGISFSEFLGLCKPSAKSRFWLPGLWFQALMIWLGRLARIKDSKSRQTLLTVLICTLVYGGPILLCVGVGLHYRSNEQQSLARWESVTGTVTAKSGVAGTVTPELSPMTITYRVGGVSYVVRDSLRWDTELGHRVRVYYVPGGNNAQLVEPRAYWDIPMVVVLAIGGFVCVYLFSLYISAVPSRPSVDKSRRKRQPPLEPLSGSDLLANPESPHLS